MDVHRDVITIVGRVLNIDNRSGAFDRQTRLLGNIPELDSMAVATLLTSLEEHFGFIVADDEVDGSTFATVGSLVDFIEAKLTSRQARHSGPP